MSLDQDWLELGKEILDYTRGRGKYEFWRLPDEERATAAFDAWIDLEYRLSILIERATNIGNES